MIQWVTACILKGHKGNIENIALIADKLNPNNILIASSSTDSTIKIWNYVLNDSGILDKFQNLIITISNEYITFFIIHKSLNLDKIEEIKESIQTIDTSYKKFFTLSLDLSYLPNSNSKYSYDILMI